MGICSKGGESSHGYIYSGSDNIDKVAWYRENFDPAYNLNIKEPNELGILHISGLNWEWCSDWYNPSFYENSPLENPTGPELGSERVIRGGSTDNYSWNCRVSRRSKFPQHSYIANLGFRLVLKK
jgi:formylglycine-generating enzyme